MGTPSRIVTVTLNAAIDQTASVPDFNVGAVNRVAREQTDAGGKGVNVASFLAHFGHDVAAAGLLGGENADVFVRLFAQRGIADRMVRVPGHTRVNVKIVDDVRDTVTDVNFPGVAAGATDLDAVVASVDDLADRGAGWFVLSGSVPVGLPATAWRDLAARLVARGGQVVLDTSGEALAAAVARGGQVVLDTSGEALAAAVAAAPLAVKPNVDELGELCGRRLEAGAEREIVAAARALRARGIGLVAVSMGARGAIFVDARQAIHAVPPSVPVRSTVGAGDAMVAGIVHATIAGLDTGACARLATAFALGALGEIGPRLPPRDEVLALASRVTVRPLDC